MENKEYTKELEEKLKKAEGRLEVIHSLTVLGVATIFSAYICSNCLFPKTGKDLARLQLRNTVKSVEYKDINKDGLTDIVLGGDKDSREIYYGILENGATNYLARCQIAQNKRAQIKSEVQEYEAGAKAQIKKFESQLEQKMNKYEDMQKQLSKEIKQYKQVKENEKKQIYSKLESEMSRYTEAK